MFYKSQKSILKILIKNPKLLDIFLGIQTELEELTNEDFEEPIFDPFKDIKIKASNIIVNKPDDNQGELGKREAPEEDKEMIATVSKMSYKDILHRQKLKKLGIDPSNPISNRP